ncbi:MAG: MarR family winged helix-turn-helix transcriptional regulator, partial [Alphaproteobacteria bacterium]|nr:MarR family winged helix-turn-helix transcriptional regulator [Alphaproteobacteria bacterium]
DIVSIDDTDSTYTLDDEPETVFIDASGGNVEVQLPSAASNDGRRYTFTCSEAPGANTITLTPEGEQILHELIPVVKRFQDEILLGLSEAERAEFLRLAAKVADAGNHLSRAPLILDRKP